jgi:hypothetical protein
LAESSLFEEKVGREAAAVARSSIEGAILAVDMPEALESRFGAFIEALEGMMSGDLPPAETLIVLQREGEGP